MKYLRYVFWLSAVYNFRLRAVHVPGVENVLSVMISRLHEPYSIHYLRVLLVMSPLSWHMLYTNIGFVYM